MLRRPLVAFCLLTTVALVARAANPLVTINGAGRLTISGSFGHSHNDYAQAEPLTGAMAAEALGIEADVFPVNGGLLVAHDPEDIRPGRTLRSMYLAPLYAEFERFGGTDEALPFRGRVRESGLPVMLLIDFKRDGELSWRLLEEQLAEYPGLCRRVETGALGNAIVTEGPVIVVVSGQCPVETIVAATARRSAIDGRYPDDLDSDRPAHLMPMVSIKFSNLKSYAATGGGIEPVLINYANRARQAGRVARAWATPDTKEAWRLLSDTGMQLINTDDPRAVAAYLERQLP